MEVCRESGTRRNLGVAATGLRDVLPSAVCVCVCQRRSGLGTEAEWDGKYRQKDRNKTTAIDAANLTAFLTASHLAHAGRAVCGLYL
jgi:hypothetical protein